MQFFSSRFPGSLQCMPLCALVVAIIGGCSVGPSFEQPATELADQWKTPAAAELGTEGAQSEWWESFGDPKLSELVTRARAANMDLRMAALRVAQSREQLGVVAGGKWPSLNGTASYQRQRQSEHGTGTRLIDVIAPPAQRDAIIDILSEPYSVYQAGFDASWEIDLWGRIRRAVESANASVALQFEEFHAVQLSMAAETARTYLELRGVDEQLRVAHEQVEAAESSVELTQTRANAGAVTELDVIQQRTVLVDIRARLPSLQDRRAQLINALALMLAEKPDALTIELSGAAVIPMPPARVPVGIPSELARRRPDIRAAEARLQVATAEVGVAVADLYPRISLTGGFLKEALDSNDLTDWGARQWSIGPKLYLPLFDGGRRRAVVELRELQQQEAAVNYQRTVLSAWHEIENAIGSYSAERNRVRELTDLVALSRDAFEIANLRYEHGMTDLLIALDAQRTLLQAEFALVDSRTRASTNLVALYKAVGSGWSDEIAK
jgi:NodT family efflux transporter outer membrane factor (OMF) lipoprotein